MGQECFTKLLTGKEFYLNDHRINGLPILPGVAYLEMARAAGTYADPLQRVIGLGNIIWTKPIQIKDQTQRMTLSLHPGALRVAFDIATSSEDHVEPIIHVHGKIIYGSKDNLRNALPTLNLSALKQRCAQQQKSHEIYAKFNTLGLNYGPSFQVIQDLYSNDTEVIACINLPTHLISGADQFELHPSLMDGALQAAVGLLEDNQKLYLPFGIGQLDVMGILPNICYAYVTRTSAIDANLPKFEIQITDETGKVLVHIRDFIVRAL